MAEAFELDTSAVEALKSVAAVVDEADVASSLADAVTEAVVKGVEPEERESVEEGA